MAGVAGKRPGECKASSSSSGNKGCCQAGRNLGHHPSHNCKEGGHPEEGQACGRLQVYPQLRGRLSRLASGIHVTHNPVEGMVPYCTVPCSTEWYAGRTHVCRAWDRQAHIDLVDCLACSLSHYPNIKLMASSCRLTGLYRTALLP